MLKKMTLALMTLVGVNQLNAQQNALDFDGVDDYVNLDVLASPMSGATDLVIQMWIKCDKAEQGNIRTTFFAINDAAGGNKLIFDVGGPYSQQGKFMIYTASGLKFTSSTIIGDNNCHHIYFINSGTQARVFIDGVYAGAFTTSLGLNSTDRYSLGQEWDPGVPSDFYNGIVDEFSIFDTALFPTNFPACIYLPLTGTEPGLVGYYKFDQGIAYGSNSSINYLSDYSSPAYNGSLLNFALDPSGATATAYSNWVPGECFTDSSLCANANEINFDGTNDYVNINTVAPSMAGSTDMTIEFWMHANLADQDTSSSRVSLFAVNGSTGNLNRFMLSLGGINSQTGNLVVTDEGAYGSIYDTISTTMIADGECHHVAYTRSGSAGKLYIDGVLEGTHTANFTLASNDLYSLGQEYDKAPIGSAILTSQFYDGYMDEFRIWDVALTQTQIQGNMSTPLTGSETNLLVYYNFNQGVSGGTNTGLTTANDLASGLNGTLTNFALTGSTSNWVMESCIACDDTSGTTRSALEGKITNTVQEPMAMSVYPNPTNGRVAIVVSGNVSNGATLTITDIAGKVVYSGSFNGYQEFETADLDKGIYLVSVNMTDQRLLEKLLVE